MLMAGGALNYLTLNLKNQLLDEDIKRHDDPGPSYHCAQEVLKRVREKTGVGNKRLERLSFAFDGGIGLKGGLCGAVTGSILALNLRHGFNLRHMNYSTNVKKMLNGQINLMKKNPGKSIDHVLHWKKDGKSIQRGCWFNRMPPNFRKKFQLSGNL